MHTGPYVPAYAYWFSLTKTNSPTGLEQEHHVVTIYIIHFYLISSSSHLFDQRRQVEMTPDSLNTKLMSSCDKAHGTVNVWGLAGPVQCVPRLGDIGFSFSVLFPECF